jgi:addiction module HigA family antidote
MARIAPIHPGEILQTEFLNEMGITPYALAKNAGIDKGNLSRIINGKSAISADTALRLGQFFGTSADSWMNLQVRYDLEVARDRGLERIEREVRPYTGGVAA